MFASPLWWDSVCKQWDVCEISMHNDTYWMPYSIVQKWGVRIIRNPHLTPYLYLLHSQTGHVQLSHPLHLTDITSQLPAHHTLQLDFAPIYTFYPHPHNQSLRTNILPLNHQEQLYHTFKPSLKRQIKKSSTLHHIEESTDVALFYELHTRSFSKYHKKPDIALSYFESTIPLMIKEGNGKLWIAYNQQHIALAAIFVVFDTKSAYYLSGGQHNEFKDSAAMPGLLWHAIQFATDRGCQYFDFEGSMVDSIHQFFQNFKAHITNYNRIHTNDSLLYSVYQKIKNAI